MATLEDAFLHDIIEHPDDDAPRLIYADWLEEHEDLAHSWSRPAAARARLIRLQCQLAAMDEYHDDRPPLQREEELLLRRHRTAWLGPLAGNTTGHSFHRGFIERVKVSAGTLLYRGRELFASAPLREVLLRSVSVMLPRLRSSVFMARIPHLNLSNTHLTHADAAQLTACHLDRLEKLAMDSNDLHDEGARLLFQAPWAQHLQGLSLARCHLTPAACYHLAVSGLRHLQQLSLADNHLGVAGLNQLLEAGLTQLRHLNMQATALQTGWIDSLAYASGLGQLETLSLGRNPLGDHCLEVLLRTPFASTLRQLDLRWTRLTAEALRPLATARLPALTHLGLAHNPLGPQGAEILAASPALSRLRFLDLSSCELGDAGLGALAASPHLSSLRQLCLGFNRAGAPGVCALAASPHLAGLTRLHLESCFMGDTGALALARSPHLNRLTHLDIRFNGSFSSETRRLLHSRFGHDVCQL